jgi:hypothetical protein
MRPDRPLLGALLWGGLGFLLAGLLLAAYFRLAAPAAQLDDHQLDERARTGKTT